MYRGGIEGNLGVHGDGLGNDDTLGNRQLWEILGSLV